MPEHVDMLELRCIAGPRHSDQDNASRPSSSRSWRSNGQSKGDVNSSAVSQLDCLLVAVQQLPVHRQIVVSSSKRLISMFRSLGANAKCKAFLRRILGVLISHKQQHSC